MKTLKFQCDDRYEAEKLASLVSVQKDDTVYVDGVSAVIGNEIVIKLKDKSSHAVLLKDRENVDRLKSLLTDVVKGKIKIRASDFSGSVAEITLD
jgi:NADP-dependent 3-hydroxy acid dehydrogenase YdfG